MDACILQMHVVINSLKNIASSNRQIKTHFNLIDSAFPLIPHFRWVFQEIVATNSSGQLRKKKMLFFYFSLNKSRNDVFLL